MATFIKTPQADLDYTLDLSEYLESGQTVSSSSWSLPSDLTETDSTFTDTTCTVFVSGGTVGKSYQLTNTFEYTDGSTTRTDSRQFTLVIANRED